MLEPVALSGRDEADLPSLCTVIDRVPAVATRTATITKRAALTFQSLCAATRTIRRDASLGGCFGRRSNRGASTEPRLTARTTMIC
jgi:hypothetical protein